MTALKAKWSEMSLYRRVLLIVMAIEILAFFFATLVMINRPGLEYQDALLYPGTEGDIQIYQGTVDGETARFAVSPEWEVSYQWGDYTYGPYQITEDPAAVPDGYEGSQGIEIRLGDEVLFRGCYLPRSTLSLIQEDGEPLWGSSSYAFASDGTILGENGRVITQQEFHEPDLYTLVRVALEPELTHRGSMGLYLAVTLLALFNIIQICFPHLFFRLSLLGRVRNIDDAEPSDFYIAMEQSEWVVLALACLLLYQAAYNQHQDYNHRNAEVEGYAGKAQGYALLDHAAGQHTYQANHRSHGQVDTAGDNDKGHAQRQDTVQSHVLGHHGQRGRRQKVTFYNAEKYNQ